MEKRCRDSWQSFIIVVRCQLLQRQPTSYHGRIPIGVVEDDGVRPGEVDPGAPGPRGEDEDKVLGVVVEPLHEALSLLDPRGAVQPEVDVAVVVEEGLEDVEHLGHLGEDEDAVAAALQLREELAHDL